ncbi:cysteine peptidase family C39 domain-containing protein [Acetivibrio straminisolvens]|uniref:cysteine peptidase family C39 domain-containing protein n=1 Tax=Acetivibrio straminisolvens TaxID=253314 RepID=UPI0012FF1A95|nr:cysteine peptidase family C39 domain-containing protein [Acetivibrio straminisolvens]
MSISLVKQHDIKDCGAACLSMICRFYGLKLPLATLRSLIKVDSNGANIYGIVNGAKQVGLSAEPLEGTLEEFLNSYNNKEIPLPLIARVIIDNTLEHFVVVYKIKGNNIYVADPYKGFLKYSYKDFFSIWTGHIIIFEKTVV